MLGTESSYRDKVRARFVAEIKELTAKYSLSELVIVLDLDSAFVLSNLFSITELVAMKILYIERLEKKRKKLDKHAVYFVEPTKANIDYIINDFSGDDPVPQYRRIHILFTTFIDKSLLKQLAHHPKVLKRIAKGSIKEFYHSNRIMAANLVDINLPILALSFSEQSAAEQSRRELMSRKLVEYIANSGKVNTVKIYYKKSPNKICERMSLALQRSIKEYLGILVANKSPNLAKQAPDLTFLMLDRSVDTVTPLLHYFTYEALLFDLFDISMESKSELKEKGALSYEQIQNPVYDEYRYKHISVALRDLPEQLEDAKGNLENLKSQKNEELSIKKLDDKITDLKANIELLQMIWKEFKNQDLQSVAELELSLATGLTSNQQNTSSSKLIAEVIELAKKPDISRDQKLRFALLCLSCIKMCKNDYEEMLGLFNSEDKQILKNLIALGVSYDSSLSKSTKTITKDQQNMAKKRMEKTGMPLNRYTSIIEMVVPLFCKILGDPLKTQKIDADVFGEITCSVFMDEEDKQQFQMSRLAVVMVGGLSWAEVSSIRGNQELNNVTLFSDSLMNASQFLKEVRKIKTMIK